MDPRLLHAFFRFAVFITLCSLLLVFAQPRDSAEFVISVCSTLIGGVMILMVVVLSRVTK